MDECKPLTVGAVAMGTYVRVVVRGVPRAAAEALIGGEGTYSPVATAAGATGRASAISPVHHRHAVFPLVFRVEGHPITWKLPGTSTNFRPRHRHAFQPSFQEVNGIL